MGEREQDLCLEEAAIMEKVAEQAEQTAAAARDPDVRATLGRASSWLRQEAERVRRWSRPLGGKLPLGRLRLYPMKIEKFLRELSARGEREMAPAVRLLDEFLEVQENRGFYEELTRTLRALAALEERKARGKEAAIHLDLVKQLERRLDRGEFDRPQPEQRERDESMLTKFQAQLQAMQSRT
ncbi:MAG: hypothetical protein HY319_19250 [Armatimonadetes bacterium]|nr:hypothetical protein [Armatimonadota bacterium]